MGNYYFAKDGNKVYFKLTGVLKYTSCAHFDTFLDDFIAHADHVESIVIDLTGATFLDSTNLGFLAKIAQFMLDKNGSQTTIYSTSKDVNQTLRGVGFDQVFNLVEDKSNLDDIFGEIDPEKFEKKDKTIMMLDAHRCLMNINEKNQQTFKDVVSLMEQSLKNKL